MREISFYTKPKKHIYSKILWWNIACFSYFVFEYICKMKNNIYTNHTGEFFLLEENSIGFPFSDFCWIYKF